MTEPTDPDLNLPVIDGRHFVVASGANLGDVLSFAEDMVLDDVYRLAPDSRTKQLALDLDAERFRVAAGSRTGQPGATVCLDCALTMMSPDGTITDALVLVELDPRARVAASYLVALAPMKPRTDYAIVGIDTAEAREVLARVACVSFTRGTRITLADGRQQPVEDLAPGDAVLTRNAGVQQIRWIGTQTVRAQGAFAPIRIRAGVLNNVRDLVVSPDHRLFIYQRQDTIGAGRSDLMVRACHLVNGDTVTVQQGGFVDYFQLLFDDHQIIFAEGIATESLHFDLRTAPVLPTELSAAMTAHETDRRLDVREGLLDRPDAAELLRRSSAP